MPGGHPRGTKETMAWNLPPEVLPIVWFQASNWVGMFEKVIRFGGVVWGGEDATKYSEIV